MEWDQGMRLGKGSFGEVFMAIPKNTKISDMKMAVKISSEDRAESLSVEHQILLKFLGTPGIIQCLDGGPSKKRTYYLLLEYASEGSLSDLISKYGEEEGTGIPENHVRVYTRMILQALSSIHSLGYVHCDIKPRNILAFPGSPAAEHGNRGDEKIRKLKVADFGLAVETWKLIQGRGNKNRGTPRYVPPEVLVDGIVTPAMDIWALGCTVLEMLTGEIPWTRLHDIEDVLMEVRDGCRPEFPGWLSESGKDFLIKCFAKDYHRRPNADSLLRHPFVSGGFQRTKVIEQVQQKQRLPGAAGFPLLPHEFCERYRTGLQV
ncbi:unnamed protein product [Linum tenue]|uniref:Protein kinase domain-containing protein n=1 Tax=Linum tenue TaxID=586396 RepID=A0AAV0QD63_9ROSI|nr:unnamed protein product [Linum tenue]CAI0542244.1 unnamed protein product [Linum tenue]